MRNFALASALYFLPTFLKIIDETAKKPRDQKTKWPIRRLEIRNCENCGNDFEHWNDQMIACNQRA